jgi:hypothetical protein
MWRHFCLGRGKKASSVARYAAEVLNAGWILLPPMAVAAAAPARARKKVFNVGAFLRRVYSNQRC